MLVNVCCSSSSGSTFLSHLLNRHPDIACGDELGLFSKPVCFDAYDYLKRRSIWIRLIGISSDPYFSDPSILRNLKSYQLSKNNVWKWVRESNDICELAAKFHDHILSLTKKKIWAEKTPTNIHLIDKFVQAFPESKVIHIIRDPRDVVMSLMGRGASLEFAAERWVTSVAAIQKYRDNEQVLEIRYEDLVNESEQALKSICSFLSIEFKMEYFLKDTYQSQGLLKRDKWGSWRLDPNQGFSKDSVEKYRNVSIDFSSVYAMKLTREYANLIDTDQYCLTDLAESYGYVIPKEHVSECKDRIVSDKKSLNINKKIGRIIRRYLVENNRPIQRVLY